MREVIDAHHHLWTLQRHPQRWIDPGTMRAILRDFTEEDWTADTDGVPLAGSVLVQTLHTADETSDLVQLAHHSTSILGVVGWADLAAPDLAERVDQVRSAAGGERLVGLRHNVENEPDPDWLLRPAVGRGLRVHQDRDLSFDLLIRADQMAAAVEMCRRLPGLRVVLDHLGKPPLRATHLDVWEKGVRALATLPQVVAKLSGLVTEARWGSWSPEDLRPATTVALDAFGPGRLMYGSDWPVCRLAGTYSTVLATADLLTSELDAGERDDVFARNAIRFYGLDPSLARKERSPTGQGSVAPRDSAVHLRHEED